MPKHQTVGGKKGQKRTNNYEVIIEVIRKSNWHHAKVACKAKAKAKVAKKSECCGKKDKKRTNKPRRY